mgnify:CR=1 FL=1
MRPDSNLTIGAAVGYTDATYDETISRALDVFERVNQDIPLQGLNWFFDHAEAISERSIDRIAALGGGVAVQHRMAYQGEYFVERYGHGAAEATPPTSRAASGPAARPASAPKIVCAAMLAMPDSRVIRMMKPSSRQKQPRVSAQAWRSEGTTP